MYLTAQRPVTDPVELLGINAYLYHHGFTWSGHPPQPLPPLVFVRGHESAPRGLLQVRRVRSYLDVVAPDDASLDEVRRAIAHLHGSIASQPAPSWHHLCGRCRVEFGLEAALSKAWHAEYHWLWSEAERLWLDPGYATIAA